MLITRETCESTSLYRTATDSSKIAIPVLYVMGEADNVTPITESPDFMEKFGNVWQMVTHPGGHFLPAASAQKQIYLAFLKDMLERSENDRRKDLPTAD